ncbi:MAG: LexA family transcriptional regulator [Flavobacteriia bacterium]|nr:LexA family transcriptional regulator [Flavobacteriia bacterium]
MNIGINLKVLRKHFGNSQEEMAKLLNLTRSTYSGYENGVAEPSIHTIVEISKKYDLSIDTLLKEDFSKIPENDLAVFLHKEYDWSGKKIRILCQTISQENEELIELIPEKASAGYTRGYADPEYLKVLPTFQLPFLSKQKKYRTFPIKGDSMPPVTEGSYVVAEYIENWLSIRNQCPCIIVSKNEGILFKIVDNHLQDKKGIELHSTNPKYPPFFLEAENILEIWKFVNYISADLPSVKPDEENLIETIHQIRNELSEIKNRLK